jgi:hypothetical protein
MKHVKMNTPRDVAIDMLIAMGARSEQLGRHRAPVPTDSLMPTSKLDESHVATVFGAKHRAAL